jgi:hypothetical protein
MFEAIYQNSLAIDETIVRKLTCLLNETSFDANISELNNLHPEDFDISSSIRQRLLETKEGMKSELERVYRYMKIMIQDRKVMAI